MAMVSAIHYLHRYMFGGWGLKSFRNIFCCCSLNLLTINEFGYALTPQHADKLTGLARTRQVRY